MPLSSNDPEYKKFLLRKNNLDPEAYDLDSSGVPRPLVKASPVLEPSNDVVNPTPTPTSSTSIGGTLLHQGAANIAPLGAGLGAAALIGGTLSGPPGWLGLAAMGLGGAGASYLASKGQEALLPDSANQQLALEQKENPKTALLGGLLPSIAAFNPIRGAANLARFTGLGASSPGIIESAATALTSPSGMKALSSEAQHLLQNTAINTGINTGLNLADQTGNGQPFSVPSLLEAAGTGALFNEPTSLGRLLPGQGGRKVAEVGNLSQEPTVNPAPNLEVVPGDIANLTPDVGHVLPDTSGNEVQLLNPDIGAAFGQPKQVATRAQAFMPEVDPRYPSPVAPRKGNTAADYEGRDVRDAMRKYKSTPEPVDINTFEGEGGPSRDNEEVVTRQQEQTKALNEAKAAQTDETIRGEQLKAAEIKKANDEKETALNAAPVEQVTSNVEVPKVEAQPQPETPTDTTKYQSEPISYDKLRDASPEYRRAVYQLASKRGITVQEASRLVRPDTGKNALGKYEPSKRQATLSNEAAGLDTPIHEVGHGYLSDLENSTDPKDRSLAKKTLDIMGGDRNGVEEELIRRVGAEGVGRTETNLYGSKKAKFDKWWTDYKAGLKNKFGLASNEDVIQHLQARLEHDAPFGSRDELSGSRVGGVASKNQDEPVEKSPDKKAYEEAVARLKAEPDFNKKMEIAKEVEAVKNRHEGMPPKYQDEPTDIKLGKESRLPKEKTQQEGLDFKSFHPTLSALDRVDKHLGSTVKPVTDAIRSFFPLKDSIQADYSLPLQKAVKGASKTELANVEKVLIAERRASKSYRDHLSTEKEEEIYDTIRATDKKIVEDRNAANMPVTDANGVKRKAKSDPFFTSNTIDPSVIKQLQESRSSDSSKKLIKDFVDHQVKYGHGGMNETKAKETLDAMLSSYDKGSSSQVKFRGLDLAQGVGLPDSWMRPGLLRNKLTYYNRIAKARAFHDTVRSNPEVAAKLGYETDPWDKPLASKEEPIHDEGLNDILHHIHGEGFDPGESFIKSLNRVATSLMLGPLTTAHVAASSLANSLSFFKATELPEAVKRLVTNNSESYKHALEQGGAKISEPIFAGLFDAHSTAIERLNSISDGISRLAGRGIAEHATKAVLQNMGEFLVNQRIPLVASGDKSAIRMMKQLDPKWSADKVYTDKEKQSLATNFSSLLHGAHDARTLPPWMLKDTAIQPFFSLASWSISQTNHFFRHAVTSASEGNLEPLLMSTLGAALGGAAIKKIREELSDKKSPIPSFKEIEAANTTSKEKLPLIAYNLASMASFAGYAGILSQGVKDLFDVAYKNNPQGASFPLDETVTASVETAAHALSAIFNTSDPKEYVAIGTKAVADLARENVQSLRLLMAHLDETGALGEERQYKKKLNTEEGELRRFEIANKMPYNEESSSNENPYYYANRKEFKHTLNLKDAASQLPSLIQDALESSNGNMEVFKQKLRALKGSSYPSMPNPERTPMTFYKYVKFLQDTQGPEAAAEHVANYYKNTTIQRAKNELVPLFD